MMKRMIRLLVLIGFLSLLLTAPAGATPPVQDAGQEDQQESKELAPTAVSETGKYLVDSAGEPFFWLADTAWDLTHRLTREEIEAYLDDRQEKGFSVIMFRVPFRDLEDEPQHVNPYGQEPFIEKDITQPNEDYFELVDFAIEEMEKRGMVAGLLPLWGFVVGGRFEYEVEDDDIVVYANWLSERYQDRKNIVWISGGDTGQNPQWEILGRELKNGDPEKLVTFHPSRQAVSSYHLFGDADWLNFHMIQTGHAPDLEGNYEVMAEIYRDSTKGVLNGEPPYEDIAVQGGARISAHQVRKAAYWSLLAGGFGHSYGHAEIFQFARAMEGQPDTWGANNPWMEALDDPGAQQMALLGDLLQGVPWQRFEPAQSLIVGENPNGPGHLRAAAMEDRSEAWIYFPEQQEALIDLGQLRRPLEARWFDPATGEMQEIGRLEEMGSERFTPPFSEDALLLLAPVVEEEGWFSGDVLRAFVLVGGACLTLLLAALIIRQVIKGIG